MTSTSTGADTGALSGNTTTNDVVTLSLLGTLPTFARAVADASNKDEYDSAIKSLTEAHGTIAMLLLMTYYKNLDAAKAANDGVMSHVSSELDPSQKEFSTEFVIHRNNYLTLLTYIHQECDSMIAETDKWLSSWTTAKGEWQAEWDEHIKESELTKKNVNAMLKKVRDGLSIPGGMGNETVQKLIDDGRRLNEAFMDKVKTFSDTTGSPE